MYVGGDYDGVVEAACVSKSFIRKAAMLGHNNLGASESESASASSETGLDTDALPVYAVVSSFKKHHPELWGDVRDLGIQMPGLPVLSSVETEVVDSERVDWC